MGFAQVITLLECVAILCFAANQHNIERKGKVNFWVTLLFIFLNIAAMSFGGFFEGAFNFTL